MLITVILHISIYSGKYIILVEFDRHEMSQLKNHWPSAHVLALFQ